MSFDLSAAGRAGSPALANPANPYDSDASRANSNYNAFRAGRLVRPLDADSPPSALTEYVHHGIRALILNPRFSCLGAKAAVRQAVYRFGVYENLASAEATAGLSRDLWTFAAERPELASDYTTFIASFTGPTALGEAGFERLLWAQLQALHELDSEHNRWDPEVSADPADEHFSFSFAGTAFFVVGLHASSSRWARRFGWPTLVFNPHAQFGRLRQRGKYNRFREAIRTRERALQGGINPNLADFGTASEARQYSGREVEPGWTCPFHARSEGD